MTTSDAAIYFLPDGYETNQTKLMGRQSAGNGFLRAAASAQEGRTLWGLCSNEKAAEKFVSMTRSVVPKLKVQTLGRNNVSGLSTPGALYLPGPDLVEHAFLRMRVGSSAHSLVGVTHTTCSHWAMDRLTSLLEAPVMPWDALICTSEAVQQSVLRLFEVQKEYLRWRFGGDLRLTVPKLPVIPLGVHIDDFAVTETQRSKARASLGLEPGTVLALFVGRLSIHAKANPHAMYLALERAAQATKQPVTLLECGWFANELTENTFMDGAARTCPTVQHLITDGRDPARRREAFAAADIFVSLSDNYQETFGLTPIEAMAAGLPTVVSDWNGYRDTVRDGIDGYRIPTAAPAHDTPSELGFSHETGTLNYDHYIGASSLAVSIDHEAAARRLTELVAQPELRRKLGGAGRARAITNFDWNKVYLRYRDLYNELAEIRQTSSKSCFSNAPARRPGRLEPFDLFRGYPTSSIRDDTLVRLVNPISEWSDICSNPLFQIFGSMLVQSTAAAQIARVLSSGPRTLAEIEAATRVKPDRLRLEIAQLLKADFLALVC